MAEAILRHRGEPGFSAYSAGSHPAGRIHPNALKQMQTAGLPVEGLRSKSWDEFAARGSPAMHFIFTLCDSAAAEVCPLWPGQPVTAHWGLPDPGSVTGGPEALERSFRDAFITLDRRIGLFLNVPLRKLDSLLMKKEADRIGRE
jgi:arsenate reductase